MLSCRFARGGISGYSLSPTGSDTTVDRSKSLKVRLSPIVEELVRSGIPLAQARNEFERQLIVAALRLHQGNVSNCAKALGIHRNTLRNKVGSLQIRATDYSPRPSARGR